MPSSFTEDMSSVSSDLTLVDLPRVCSKTKSHVEGNTVPDGQLFAREIVTFGTLGQVRCDLCLKRDKFDHNPRNNAKVNFPVILPSSLQC